MLASAEVVLADMSLASRIPEDISPSPWPRVLDSITDVGRQNGNCHCLPATQHVRRYEDITANIK